MSHRACRQMVVAAIATVLGLALTASVGWAGPQVFDPQNNCATINCLATVLNATYVHDQNHNANPFILQVFTSGNECLRIDVTAQATDLETTLTCPSGRTWQNDDRAFFDLRPLIKAITPAPRGWCTLTISHFNGEGPLAPVNFTVAIGRYPSGNVNCVPPTAGVFVPEGAEPLGAEPAKPSNGEEVGPRGGPTQP
jgi:hypothetical protein